MKYKGIDKEKIKDVAEVRFERSKFPQLDMQLVEDALKNSESFFDKIREFAKSEALRYAYDLDMCCICEMAMLYLDEKENATNYGKSMYDKGLNDAWNVLKGICFLPENGGWKADKCIEIFGQDDAHDVLANLSPQEALAKIEAYEKEQAQIKVGDVVDHDGLKSVVVRVADNIVYAVTSFGTTPCYAMDYVKLKKTGQHIDIQSILSQIDGGKE